MSRILHELTDLTRLDDVRRLPARHSRPINKTQIKSETFSDFLADIFKLDTVFDNGSINDFLAQMRQQPCDHARIESSIAENETEKMRR